MKLKTKYFLSLIAPIILIDFIIFAGTYYLYSKEFALSLSFLLINTGIFLILASIYLVISKNLALLVTNRINQILEFTKNVLEGNFKAQLNIKGKDEITELGKNVTSLAEQLNNALNSDHKIISQKNKQIEELEQELKIQQDATLKVLKEIDDEKNKSEHQAQELKKFQLAVQESKDLIIISDPNFKIIYANKASEKISGYKVEELLNMSSEIFWHDTMNENLKKDLLNQIVKNKATFEAEINSIRKNSEEYIASLTVSPILNDKKEILFYVTVIRDITEEKQIDRMKSEFISLASHQLRSPLSAAKWGIEMLLSGDDGKLTQRQKKRASDIYIQNNKTIQIVENLLNISRLESGKIKVDLSEINLYQFLNDLIEEAKIKAEEKNQKIILNIDKDVPTKINTDPNLLRHVYINLIGNAIKYSNNNSNIEISIKLSGDEIINEVKDNGIGIPDADKKSLFTKFYRAENAVKNNVEGTGLGLYLAKLIVERLGGVIWFESQLNVGTTFWFTIKLNIEEEQVKKDEKVQNII